jgi:hypothetical protein
VDIGDIDALAGAMDRIAADPVGAAAMGQRGRDLILERYDLELIVREHERLYSGLFTNR